LNDYLAAVVLGIVEGLTEFLPVSSTAHLRLTQGLLGQDLTDEYWKMFSVVIQLGAILAVLVYFAPRLLGFVRSFPGARDSGRPWWLHPLSLVAISFCVTALPCFLIEKLIGENLEKLSVIGAALLVGGVVMGWVDGQYSQRATTHDVREMTLLQAVVIGLAQILSAAFPGTSRSMSTIAGGQVMGLSRAAALEFSFFLSIPVMIAATGYKLLKYLRDLPTGMALDRWLVLGIGFTVSFIVALAVIAWFMRWVRTRGFAPFAIYRIAIGAIVLILSLRG
jgi:undecaprenyl-diphosphatase